jgi:hypothetical protein
LNEKKPRYCERDIIRIMHILLIAVLCFPLKTFSSSDIQEESLKKTSPSVLFPVVTYKKEQESAIKKNPVPTSFLLKEKNKTLFSLLGKDIPNKPRGHRKILKSLPISSQLDLLRRERENSKKLEPSTENNTELKCRTINRPLKNGGEQSPFIKNRKDKNTIS